MRCSDCIAFRPMGVCASSESPRPGAVVRASDEPCGAAVFNGDDGTCYRCGSFADGHDIDVFEHREGAFPRFTMRLCARCSSDFERWALKMEPDPQGRLF